MMKSKGGIISRCPWAENASDLEKRYHDQEWGRAVHDDRVFFEFLILEGAQAGLSWSTILNKREGYRELFDDFDVEKVAKYDESRILAILENPKIVRNKLKVRSAVKNAQIFLQIQKEFGSFTSYIWQFIGETQIKNSPKAGSEIPVSTEISDTISENLKKRGMSFVGTTIMYAFMQATGLVDDHTTDCFCYEKS